MSPTLLFFDAETSGLDDAATVLEAAWTLTDITGQLLVPLRSRFCQISHRRPVIPLTRSASGAAIWNDGVDEGWPPPDGKALEMGVESGLFDAWLRCPERRRIQSGPELQRLILDDIDSVCDPDTVVHLAGSGVAQFDHPLLRLHCPELVVPRGEFGGPVHYRTVDQSVTLTTLTGASNEPMTTALIAWYFRLDGSTDPDIPLAIRPQYAYGDDVPAAWMAGERGKHRAAPDVARAIVAHRALWAYGASLRTDLGIT
jgi:hypothetical protein